MTPSRSRTDYGRALIERLSSDLTARFGLGFGPRNLFQMRAFHLAYPDKSADAVCTIDLAHLAGIPGWPYLGQPLCAMVHV